tara:strand:+ start:355 stop:3567 length:3213 start_codon:yes stop_codon:yes gene_type:complete
MVVIYGSHFTSRNCFCRFGTALPMVNGIYNPSKQTLTCVAPRNEQNTPSRLQQQENEMRNTVYLEVSTNGGSDWSTSQVTYTYVRVPTVFSVLPENGPHTTNDDGIIGIEYDSDDITHCQYGVSKIVATKMYDETNMTTFRCARERRAHGGENEITGVRFPVRMGMNDITNQNNDVGAYTNLYYTHTKQTAVHRIVPSSGPSSGGTMLTILGNNFTNTNQLVCRFGTHVTVAGRWFSNEEIHCVTPKHLPSVVYVEVSNNGGVDFSHSRMEYTFHASPSVTSINPTHGPERGMTLVTVIGHHFVNSPSLGCAFGTVRTQVQKYVSKNEVVCYAPGSSGSVRIGRPGSVEIEITNNNQTYTTNAVRYTYDATALVSVLSPSSGPSSGGTRVILYGYGFRDYKSTLGCKFGDVNVVGHFISDTEIECVTPAMPVQTVSVEMTLNGYDYTFSKVDYQYQPSIHITNIWPSMGPAYAGGTVVTVRGYGFLESIHLTCRFGAHATSPARYIDSNTIVCRAPPSRPGLASFEVSNNLVDFSSSNFRYYYHTDVSVGWLRPDRALITGQRPVFVRGTNFMNTTSLKCRFGNGGEVRAIFLKSTLVVCTAPSKVVGYGINATRLQRVNVDVSNNGLDYSASHVKFEYHLECPKANYCPHLDMLQTPNGTTSSNPGEFNFTLCEPGTFQPRQGQQRCLQCPIGYICPDFGLSKPIICPAGFVCNKQGLRSAVSRCPSGHYCLQGTKTSDTRDFYGLAPHSYWSSVSSDNARTSGARSLAHYSWIIAPETGMLRYNESVRNWKYLVRPPPATGTSRPEHSPTMLTGGESHTTGGVYGPTNTVMTRHLRFVKHDRSMQYPISREKLKNVGLFEDNAILLAERPFPCPMGMYCKTGAVNNVSVPKNFSHPQRCMDGFFCPFGSASPEGTGPCPTGYFCQLKLTETHQERRLQVQKIPIYEATACPIGMYCPGVGVTAPKPCYPGTYNPFTGQSNCTTCPTGHICPGKLRRITDSINSLYNNQTGSPLILYFLLLLFFINFFHICIHLLYTDIFFSFHSIIFLFFRLGSKHCTTLPCWLCLHE